MARIVSKPSKKYSQNFEAIFGKQPDKPRKTRRRYFVYDLDKGKTVDIREKPRRAKSCALWPMHSDSLGVAKHQIEKAAKALADAGIPTDFDKEGRAILRDPHHRARVAEHFGMYDLNGGYSDPQRHGRGARRFHDECAEAAEKKEGIFDVNDLSAYDGF